MRGAMFVFAAMSAVVFAPSVHAETMNQPEAAAPSARLVQVQHAAIGELALTPGAAALAAAAGAFAMVGRRRSQDEAA